MFTNTTILVGISSTFSMFDKICKKTTVPAEDCEATLKMIGILNHHRADSKVKSSSPARIVNL